MVESSNILINIRLLYHLATKCKRYNSVSLKGNDDVVTISLWNNNVEVQLKIPPVVFELGP